MAQCPSCGHHPLNTSIAADESAPSVERVGNEVGFLDEQILRLEQTIARYKEGIIRLERDKVALKRRLNDVRAATARLPPEVLSDIFQFVRPPIDFSTRVLSCRRATSPRKNDTYFREEDFHLDLAAVSHHWRRVVWSTPQLWNSISVGIRLDTVDNTIPLLDTHFRNAQGLPMSMEVDLRSFRSDTAALSHDLLEIMDIEIFSSYSSKIGSLILIGFPPTWTSRIINKNLLQCVSVTVRLPKSEPHTTEIPAHDSPICFAELPRLREVKLDCVKTPFTLPLLSLSTLDVYCVPSKVCLDALLKCPNLLEFKMGHLGTAIQGQPTLTQPTMLKGLRSLTWTADCRNECSRAFIRYCRFPSLHTLVWSGQSDGYFEAIHMENGKLYQEFISFFYNLPSTLTSLTLDWIVPDSHRPILDVLLCVPQVTELRVIHSDLLYDFCEFIGRPIDTLINDDYTPHPSIKHIEGSRILPCLRKLILDSTYVGCPDRCLEMLERLHAAGMNEERFYFKASTSKRSWDKSVIVSRLRPLVASGFNLSFTLGNCELDLT